MRDYLQEKKDEKRRHKKIKIQIIIGAVLCVLLCIGIVFLLRSSWFHIKEVSVQSPQFSEELKESFTEEYQKTSSKFASIFFSENTILNIDKEDIQKNLTQKFPSLDEITIKKNIITRTVSIEAKEREKDGLWCQRKEEGGQHCMWFDKNGLLFLEAPEIEGNSVPKILSEQANNSLKIGDEIPVKTNLTTIRNLFSFLEKGNVPTRTLIVPSLDTPNIQTPTLTAYPVIYFSIKNDPTNLLNAFSEIAHKETLSYIDLRVKDRIFYK